MQANKFQRDLVISKAELCKQSGRFDDMVMVMNGLCRTDGDLTVEERNLLSCKNVIGSRRTINENLHKHAQRLKTIVHKR